VAEGYIFRADTETEHSQVGFFFSKEVCIEPLPIRWSFKLPPNTKERRNMRKVVLSITLTLAVILGLTLGAVSVFAAAPSNDNFADAAVITGTSGNTTGTNVEATIEDGEPPISADTDSTETVWWSWTAPTTGTAAFDTLGSSFDTVMAAYTGDNVSSLTLLSTSDDAWLGSRDSRVVFKVTEATTYHIAVAGYGHATGNITLNWGYAIPPANDDFPGETISGTSGSSVFSSDNATREDGEPDLNLGYNGFSSLWWSWTAPSSGNVTFDTNGSWDTDEEPLTVLAIYTGTSLGSLILIDYDDYWPYCEVEFSAVEGTTYRIAVDGQYDCYFSQGSIHLNWRYPLIPIFTSANSTAFVVGTAGLFDIITEADPVASSINITGTLPTDVNFINVGDGTAILTGTPAAGTGGTYPLTFSANNTFFATTQNFTLTVNEAPAFVSANSTTFSTGSPNSFTVNATGYPTPSVSLTSDTPPSGVAYNSSTGVLSGTPTEGGTFALIFTASNGVSPNATQNFTLNVVGNAAPTITTPPQHVVVVEGQSANFTVEYYADPAPTFQWQISRNGGGRWSDIRGADSATYDISATPSRMSGNLYRVVISNDLGTATSDPATLTVMPGPYTTADVSIDKTDGVYDSLNGTISWNITVTNSGPDTAEGVTVADNLARGTRFSSITGISETQVKVKGSSVTITIGSLTNGESVSFTIVALVTRATSPVDNSATATVGTTTYDPDLSNNTDSAACSW
jgi:uncharacterized repeat protein (TIGR01451 family)